MRGNRSRVGWRIFNEGSIPACAGEPTTEYVSRVGRWVYPRVCGGTSAQPHSVAHSKGLSPRVRGNLSITDPRTIRLGSIPACAGEPRTPGPSKTSYRVYPRVCGGTGITGYPRGRIQGLSPRVRGNRPDKSGKAFTTGSIPACAGEPSSDYAYALVGRVYPRVCGGTLTVPSSIRCAWGLSPRVRGNHQQE